MRRGVQILILAIALGAGAARAQAPISDPAAFRPLTVGSDLGYAPFAVRQPDGKIAGFSVDVAWEIAKRLGRPGVEVIETPAAGLFSGLNAKRYEFVAAPVIVTAERAQQMLFTEPYLSGGYGVLLRATETGLKSLDDLKGKPVAVVRGAAAGTYAAENASRHGFEPQRLERVQDVIQSVIDGKAYAGLVDLPLALHAATQHPSLKPGLTILSGRVVAFAFRQDDVAFRNRVELIVEDMKRDGVLASLYRGWFGAEPPPDSVMRTIDDAHFGAAGFAGHGAK
jgi:polar amino acid transport system substrate-binding protein